MEIKHFVQKKKRAPFKLKNNVLRTYFLVLYYISIVVLIIIVDSNTYIRYILYGQNYYFGPAYNTPLFEGWNVFLNTNSYYIFNR